MTSRSGSPRLRTAWYGLIVVASLLPALTLAPWLSEQAHTLLLERAMLAEKVYHKEVETRISLEIQRLETVLRNKSDPIIYFLNRDDLPRIRKLLKKITRREMMINSVAIYDRNAVPIFWPFREENMPMPS